MAGAVFAEGRPSRPSGFRLSHRDGILTILVVLGIVNVLFTMDATARGHGPRASDIPAEIVMHLALCLLGYLLFLVMHAVDRAPVVLRLLLIFLTCVAFGSLMFPLFYGVFHILAPEKIETPWLGFTFRRIHEGTIPFLLTAAGLMVVDFYRKVEDREAQLLRSQALSRQAQMLALRYQIDPHFLFNALNSVMSLVLLRRNDAAEDLLLRLSDFFRHTLELGTSETVALEQELELQQAYFHVEQARFGDALTLEIEVETGLGDLQVPPMLLQPLLENAIKHGARKGVIRIDARSLEDSVVLTVTNGVETFGALERVVGTRTGVRNVEGRLRSVFGPEAVLEMDQSQAGVYQARLILPRMARQTAGSTTVTFASGEIA